MNPSPAPKIESLVKEMVFGTNPAASQGQIRKMAGENGLFFASIQNLYSEIGKRYAGFTVPAMNLRGILSTAYQALATPKLVIGTAMLAIFFFLWLAVLSWEDLSVALPMQALNYVLVAFLSQYFLGETVSPLRWAGTVLVCVGVIMITKSSGS